MKKEEILDLAKRALRAAPYEWDFDGYADAIVAEFEPAIRRLEQERERLKAANESLRQARRVECRDAGATEAGLRHEVGDLQREVTELRARAEKAEALASSLSDDFDKEIKRSNTAEDRVAKLEAYAGDLAQMLRALIKSPGLLSENEPFRAMAAGALTLAPPSGPSTGEAKEERSKEWWLARARAEGDATIGAVGGAVEPLRCAYPLTNLSSRPGLPECGNLMPCVEHAGWCEPDPSPAPPAEEPAEKPSTTSRSVLRRVARQKGECDFIIGRVGSIEVTCGKPADHEGGHGSDQKAYLAPEAPHGSEGACPRCAGLDGTHTRRDCKPEPPSAEKRITDHEFVTPKRTHPLNGMDRCADALTSDGWYCGQPAAAHEGSRER